MIILKVTEWGNTSHTKMRGQTFLHTRGDKHFYIKGGGQTFLHKAGWDEYVGGGCGCDNSYID